MPGHDLFGMAEEATLVASGVRDIFTPHQPIASAQLLFGREDEVSRLLQHLSTPGQHVLLYGDRGVGKTSLANIIRVLIPMSVGEQKKVIVCRCDSMTTFSTIIYRVLDGVGIDGPATGTSSVHAEGAKAGLAIPVVSAGVHTQRSTTINRPATEHLSPSWAADQLANFDALLLIDEADAIRDKADLRLLAEFVKLLSDVGSSLKVMLVGIAATGEELTDGHQSVVRCLKETKLGEMSATELGGIVTQGAKKLGLSFSADALNEIVDISAGYPHFTHLLALKCAEAALAKKTRAVTRDALHLALASAAADAEASLHAKFEDAVRSQRREKFEAILFAAAQLGKTDFRAAEWRGAFLNVTGREINQNALNNYMGTLVGKDKIMHRTGHGIYRLSDPRMASFIRIRLGNTNWSDA